MPSNGPRHSGADLPGAGPGAGRWRLRPTGRPRHCRIEARLGHLQQRRTSATTVGSPGCLRGGSALRIDERVFSRSPFWLPREVRASYFFRKAFSISNSRVRRSSSRSRARSGAIPAAVRPRLVCGPVFLHPAADGFVLVEPVYSAGHLGARHRRRIATRPPISLPRHE